MNHFHFCPLCGRTKLQLPAVCKERKCFKTAAHVQQIQGGSLPPPALMHIRYETDIYLGEFG